MILASLSTAVNRKTPLRIYNLSSFFMYFASTTPDKTAPNKYISANAKKPVIIFKRKRFVGTLSIITRQITDDMLESNTIFK